MPTPRTVDGPLLGNGQLAVAVGGSPDRLSFHFGSNAFVRTAAMTSAAAPWGPAAPGGVDLACPPLANASFEAAQFVANGTVTTSFAKPGVGRLRTASFVRPALGGGSVMATELRFEPDSSGVAALPVRLTARAGPLVGVDEFLISGPCAAGARQLTAQRANGEDWQVKTHATPSSFANLGPIRASLGPIWGHLDVKF